MTLGNTLEPGIVSEFQTTAPAERSAESPADAVLVGPADLANNSGSANTVEQISLASTGYDLFGAGTLLGEAVDDAIAEGANPVYAVATAESSVSDNIGSLGSTAGTLNSPPIKADGSELAVTVDGTTFSTTFVYYDPSTGSPAAEEALVNPETGDFELGTAPSSSGSIDYTSLDYASAIDAAVNEVADEVDFLVPLSENSSVKTDALTTVENLTSDYRLAMAILGGPLVSDPGSVTRTVDSERAQVVYPSRDGDRLSTLGAFAGLRARIGINTTPINKRLASVPNLQHDLTESQRGTLINEKIVPLDEGIEARVADDVLAVADSTNADARYGFNRLVNDFVAEVLRVNEQPFIGELNSPSARDALETMVENDLSGLTKTNAVIDFRINVRYVSATEAEAELYVETAKPLRTIKNTIAVGNTN